MRYTYRYLFEGESEQNLICSLKSEKRITAGRHEKVNLWEKDIANRIRTFNSNDIVIVIFDTDVTSQMLRFTRNVTLLTRKVKTVILLPQHPSLEPELAYACNIPFKDFPEHLYRVQTLSDLKRKLTNDKALMRTLDTKMFDINRMWCRKDCNRTIQLPLKGNLYWGADKIRP